MGSLATKKDFAAELGVTPGRLSQYIADGKISGAAIVGSGVRAQINVDIAKGQLRKNLDVSQSTGMNAKARVQPAPAAASTFPSGRPLEDHIKFQRLRQLKAANEKAQLEAAVRAGKYVKADEARLAAGRIAGQLMSTFEASLTEFANAIAAQSDLSTRDAMRLLRGVWRQMRERQATATRAAAEAMPATIDVPGEDAG
jgi:hypothetical protein